MHGRNDFLELKLEVVKRKRPTLSHVLRQLSQLLYVPVIEKKGKTIHADTIRKVKILKVKLHFMIAFTKKNKGDITL